MNHQNSRWLALIGLAILLVLYGLNSAGLLGDNPIGRSGQDSSPLVVPAGYAFAIWAPIYLGLIAFPIYQAIQKTANNQGWITFRGWYTANVIANGLWLLAASYNWLWISVAIIVFMLYSLVQMRTLLKQLKASNTPVHFWIEQLPFSLYFAWITLATALNIASALYFYDWAAFGVDPLIWAVGVLIVAATIAFLVAKKYQDPAYALVVVWAFVALIVRHWAVVPILAYLSIVVVVVFTWLSVRLASIT